jgi:hypothetical protein
MKKFILIALLTSSSIFAQKLTKEELTDKMSDIGCECANKQEITKENMELTLGLCLLEAINKHEKDVEKYYGKNVISSDKKMEELGYDIGLKMGAKCPSVFKFMMDDFDESDDEEYVEEVLDEMVSGNLTEIKFDQFLTFSIKEQSGKMNQFLLLSSFDNAFLVTDKVLKTNDTIEVYYYELEVFDAKLAKFVTYKVVTDIIKK